MSSPDIAQKGARGGVKMEVLVLLLFGWWLSNHSLRELWSLLALQTFIQAVFPGFYDAIW
jgi:hypothetical protein